MRQIDSKTGEMYSQKMRNVVTATLFNLHSRIKRISLTVIGAGLPELVNIGRVDEHVCREDLVDTSCPILILNYEVDTNEIWKLDQRLKSQISRMENLAQKLSSKFRENFTSEHLDKNLQNLIFVLTKSEPKALPIVIYVTD